MVTLIEYDEVTFREKAIIATRQLAKRQFTWLRQQTKTTLLDIAAPRVLEQVLSEVNKKTMR